MGHGYTYKCDKCHYEYSVYLGIGMRHPVVYIRKLDEIDEGKHGAEWQELYRQTPYAAIDAANVIYICTDCNYWEKGTDITLYAPNDPESIPHKQYGEKTVSEWGYVPYVMDWELKEAYHVLKRYYHRCSRCGKRMHKATDAELRKLPCPKCGYTNEVAMPLMWD